MYASIELSRDWLANTLTECEALGIRQQFETEVFSYGYLPLAYSARCFTARAENKAKDDCETCCIKYPQGITVNSQEDQKNLHPQWHSNPIRLLL